jgi:spore germination protein KC
MFITTGCWNSRELSSVSILVGYGIDKAEESDKVQLTAQVVKIGQMAASKQGGGSSGEEAFWNIKTSAETIFQAIRSMTFTVNRRLIGSHNQVTIISQDVAKEGISKYLELYIRDHDNPRRVWLLISKGDASEVLEVKPELEKIPARYIAQLVETSAATSQVGTANLQEVYTRLMSKTTAPILSMIEVLGEGEDKALQLTGTAVLKKDKYVGNLDKTETRGLLWVLGEIKGGVIVVECGKDKEEASLEIIKADSKIIPEIKDDKINITVKITEEGNIAELMCSQDVESPEVKATLEERKADIIRNEIMAALEKAKEWNTDIFGFGDAVHRKYPKQWKELEDKWDEIFPNIDVTIEVDAKLKGAGLVKKWFSSE